MIVRLSRETSPNLNIIGGKACGLVRLLCAGFRVPGAWCIPASSTEGGDLSPELEGVLRGLWEKFVALRPGGRLAVRSSATAEDLDEASFAGIYQTKLDIDSADGLVAAVRECLSAVHAARAREYRSRQNLGHDLRIALVIQRMIDPEVSGVMLTVNPRRPFANEVVIDAAYGLGEAVVSGTTHPDHLVLDRRTGDLREKHVGPKEMEFRYLPGRGHVELEVDAGRRDRICLSDAQVRKLWELAREVGERIGPRQDIEWAIEGGELYVLQQRPITGLPPEKPKTIWTRKFGDEYLADYMTPLGHTVLTRWISEDYLQDMARLSGNNELAGLEPIRRYHGYAYMNGDYMARMLKAIPPRFRKTDALGWFTPKWEQQLQSLPFEPRQLIGMIQAPSRDPRSPITKNPAVLEIHCANVEKTIRPKLFQDYRVLSQEEWQRQFAEAYELGREHFRVIRWGMGFYNPMLHGLLQASLRSFVEDADGEFYRALISGLPGTRTVEINRDVWKLGCEARKDPEFVRKLLSGAPYPDIRRDIPQHLFWTPFDAFMDRHGHRAATREISQPRWRETPDVVLGFVRAQIHGEAPPDPAHAEAGAVSRREEAERAVLRRAGRGAGGLVRRKFLKWLFRQTQTYTRYRENQRYYLDYLLFHIRNLMLEQARRFQEKGLLKDPFEVFFLEREELWELIRDSSSIPDVRSRLDERLDDYHVWKNRLPATYLFDGIETEGEIVEGDPSSSVEPGADTGLGASRGIARGKARVVTELSQVETVERGEILVASNTDPGWTSVFPLLAGLVTETGGLLSHGALLAREYGIPAVTGVKGATSVIRTGDLIEIDGSRGTLKHMEPVPKAAS